jgi:hypothetical protein
MAPIIRGADTDRHDFSPYSAGLWAISSGLSYNILDDHQLLAQGAIIYDALYAWASHLQKAKHVQSSVERILVGLSAEGNLMNENTQLGTRPQTSLTRLYRCRFELFT